jgi:hypothetical protein
MFERISPWSSRLGCDVATAAGPVDHFRGELATTVGHYDEANAFFVQFHAARTNLSWGKNAGRTPAPADIEKVAIFSPGRILTQRPTGRDGGAPRFRRSPKVEGLTSKPAAPARILAGACSLLPGSNAARHSELSIKP